MSTDRPASAARRPSARSVRPKPGPRASVRLEGGALRFSGQGQERDVPIWAGAVHYFRAPRSEWRAQLEAARDLGLTAIETYVPWQVHEISAGRFDFGEHDERLDVAAFVDLIGELGLYAIIRPGPHINSEMTFFGLPERIVYDRACQARSPRQAPVVLGFPPRMFPVPSYASETFFGEVERWYAAVGEVLASRMHPHGPIVVMQVDNEAAFYFRDGPYDQDYHPDALAQWRNWVAERHPTESERLRVHGVADVERIEPPTSLDVCGDDDGGDASKLGRHLDWAAFREAIITAAIARMKAMLEKVGLGGVPTIHNLPLGELACPVSLPALEGVVDAVGLDYYHATREHSVIKRRTLFLVGSSRLPLSPEMGVGAPYWFTPLSEDDSLYCTMVCLAYGLRGMSLYMAVDRDRWYGAPIDGSGRPRRAARSWHALLTALRRTDFHRATRRAPVGIVVPREYLRLARAAHALGFVSPVWLEAARGSPIIGASEETLGLEVPVQVAFFQQIERWMAALEAEGISYVLVDSDVALERTADLEVLISPSYELASPERFRLLSAFSQREGGRVILGPTLPRCDDTMRPRPFELPRDAVVLGPEMDEAEAVALLLSERPTLRDEVRITAGCEVTVHRHGGDVAALFVVNPHGAQRQARIDGLSLPVGTLLRDVVSGRHHAPEGGSLVVSIAAERCVMLEPVSGDERAPADDEDDGVSDEDEL